MGQPLLVFLSKPVGLVVGFVYPAYKSYKALEGKAGDQTQAWLVYWIIFSLFVMIEQLLDLFFPGSVAVHLGMLAFIVWLQLPQTKGAMMLYVTYVSPLVKKHEADIDRALEEGLRKGNETVRRIQARAGAYIRGPHAGSAAGLGGMRGEMDGLGGGSSAASGSRLPSERASSPNTMHAQ